MRVWRIARAVHPALDGEGARLYGGRWNSPGMQVVYTAASASLATVERLVATDPDELPDDLVLFEIDIPADAPPESVDVATLPDDWREPRSPDCRQLGDAWIASGRSALLAVPSAVVPEDFNVLINPRHPEAQGVRIVRQRPFRFDPRLIR